MDKNEWYDKYNSLIKQTIDNLFENTDNITGADVGLILRVVEDYIDRPDKNLDRCVKTIEIAKLVLDLKYEVDNISWFDIYDIIQVFYSEVDCPYDLEDDNDRKKREIYNINNGSSEHAWEFTDCVRKLFECATEEDAKELINTAPYDDSPEEFCHFKQAIKNTSNRAFGSVEVPNNGDRLNVSTTLSGEFQKINSKDDFHHICLVISDWVRMYARAEATLADRNTTRTELKNFMIDEETPAEKYF